ncbi:hypothetical protein BDZ89DRAFT_1193754 [Hymenopellis radicata]|nr:hypothetical protein BDZ89DRAFT_1193754 [Hymenopellis radicata]
MNLKRCLCQVNNLASNVHDDMATLQGHGSLRVIVLDDYQNVALGNADWSLLYDKASIEVFNEAIDPENVASRLQKYDIICAMRERTKFPADILEKLPNLKLLITTGMNNRGIDVAFAKERGIIVSGTSSQGNSTMEHIWAIILATVRYIALEDKNIKENNPQWQTVVPFGLTGKTLGLLGVGGLGSRTAQIAKVFGMRVLGWSPHLTPERARKLASSLLHRKRSS